MVITRSPEGRDNDRPFSGPEIAVAGASTSGSVVPSVSQTEEQAKSATGASNDVTEAESVDESTDASMDTSFRWRFDRPRAEPTTGINRRGRRW